MEEMDPLGILRGTIFYPQIPPPPLSLCFMVISRHDHDIFLSFWSKVMESANCGLKPQKPQGQTNALPLRLNGKLTYTGLRSLFNTPHLACADCLCLKLSHYSRFSPPPYIRLAPALLQKISCVLSKHWSTSNFPEITNPY